MSYYYFVASLPTLTLGAPASASLADFRAEAVRLLPAETVAELEAVLQADHGSARSTFAARWFAAETQLRNAVARTRAARRGVEALPFLHEHAGFSVQIEQAVTEAYGRGNPLERELALDRLRWAQLEELSRESPFGVEAVLAYGLKLQLVERWAGLTDEAGQAALQAAVKQVREASV